MFKIEIHTAQTYIFKITLYVIQQDKSTLCKIHWMIKQKKIVM